MNFVLPGGFLKAPKPAPYVPPEATVAEEVPGKEDAAVKKKSADKRQAASKRTGYDKNVLGTPSGAAGTATTERKKLLGS
jgi:hypothetical protein